MQEITESELLDNAKNGAIEYLEIDLNNEGKGYEVKIKLTWKQDLSILTTQRKKIRIWASFDRLIKHIEKNYMHDIQIVIKRKETD
jgi:hypothetical protein